MRHNDIRDLTASLLTEVCSQVIVEPELQPVSNSDEYPLATSNTQDGTRLDVVMNGFWGVVNQRNALLMSEFSILMLPQISALHCLLPIKSMRTSNGVLMANISEKLNTPHSFPWFFLLLEVWLMKPLPFTNIWLLLSNKWGIITRLL